MIDLATARANHVPIDWSSAPITKPKFIGRRVFRNFDLAQIAEYIDWGPFFQTWELHGPYPQILTDEVVGESARRVFSDGQMMLKKIIANRWLQASAVVGFYPANSINGEDIEIYADESRERVLLTWYGLRQQNKKPDGTPNRALADYIAPKSSGRTDYIGAFASPQVWAVTSGSHSSRPSTTIIPRSCSRPLPTVLPRRSPRPCTSACGVICGATLPARR